MADGLNNARAMRIAEIMNDFRALQYHIATLQATPRPEEYYLEGHTWLRHAISEAQSVLAQEYNHEPQHPQGDPESEKSLLKLIIIDANIRRFQCQRAYMRAVVCRRWVDVRAAVLQGQPANPTNQAQVAQLQTLDASLRADISMITDEQVEEVLRSSDEAQRKYVDDDPPLETIQAQLRLRGS